jgi:hypothetical protein
LLLACLQLLIYAIILKSTTSATTENISWSDRYWCPRVFSVPIPLCTGISLLFPIRCVADFRAATSALRFFALCGPISSRGTAIVETMGFKMLLVMLAINFQILKAMEEDFYKPPVAAMVTLLKPHPKKRRVRLKRRRLIRYRNDDYLRILLLILLLGGDVERHPGPMTIGEKGANGAQQSNMYDPDWDELPTQKQVR